MYYAVRGTVYYVVLCRHIVLCAAERLANDRRTTAERLANDR